MIDFEDENNQRRNHILGQLFIKYSKLMFFIANKILRDRHLAEDAVQKAFLNLENSKIGIDSISSDRTRSLMTIIIRNISLTMLRDRRNHLSYESKEIEELQDKKLQPVDIIINKETVLQIQYDMRNLDNIYGDAFLLRYFYEYSVHEIGTIMGISDSLVWLRLSRARKSIMENINRE